ncbi:MAG: alkaline phosphatase family protein [Opitutaceae bacterium]
MPFYPPSPNCLQNIQRFVVLMLENRSFDHLLGFQGMQGVEVDGLTGAQGNLQNPADPNSPRIGVSRATAYSMPFDPNHEFLDVQEQLYAPGAPPAGAITMGGFVASALAAASSATDAARVMEGYYPEQLPALSALVKEAAVFNYWHSSLPGPTWPNRFYVHAGTSGGLTDSPTTAQILRGYQFPRGILYDRLGKSNWRIYHDGMPQSAGIDSLRGEYIDPLTSNFKSMADFAADAASGKLPAYTFIEPNYDTGNNYVGGDSMHPLNDIRKGEALLKAVYEAVRQSPIWASTMLIVTFDEHGGFYDHVVPPATVATGDDARYADNPPRFDFRLLGARVPALVVSAYTQPGSVVGTAPENSAAIFDHTSILKTVEDRFGLAPLTQRDANANSLAVALNLGAPRTDAPATLPDPLTDAQAAQLATQAIVNRPPSGKGLSSNQQSLVDLALRCQLDMADSTQEGALQSEHAAVTTQGAAAGYLERFEAKMAQRRRTGR